MKKYLGLLSVSILVLFTTCTRDITGPDACFAEDVLPIFISNCTFSGCHNSKKHGEGYDLTTYEGIMRGITAKHPLRSSIYTSINGKNPSMPRRPYSKLSTKDVSTIKMWILMGAPNSSNCKGCDTVNFKFSLRVNPIIQTWCVGCHNASTKGAGFDFTTYGGVVSAIANNKLLGSIKHLSGFSPMPQNIGQIQQCDITAIEKWINAGFPNN